MTGILPLSSALFENSKRSQVSVFRLFVRFKVTRRDDQRVDHRGMVMARRGAKAGAARPESEATSPR